MSYDVDKLLNETEDELGEAVDFPFGPWKAILGKGQLRTGERNGEARADSNVPVVLIEPVSGEEVSEEAVMEYSPIYFTGDARKKWQRGKFIELVRNLGGDLPAGTATYKQALDETDGLHVVADIQQAPWIKDGTPRPVVQSLVAENEYDG